MTGRAQARSRRRLVLLVSVALGVALVLVCTVCAASLARPGGGSSYSGGSSSSSSGGSSSSSRSSDLGLLELILFLCIEHPVIGIPLLIVFIIYWLAKKFFAGDGDDWSTGAHEQARHAPVISAVPRVAPAPTRPIATTLEDIRGVDPTFSEVVFEDFLYSLYAEVHRLRGAPAAAQGQGHPLDRVSAYLAPKAIDTLKRLPAGEVQAVIVGAMRLVKVDVTLQAGASVQVEFESNYTEAGKGFYSVERWWLSRKPGATSRTPDRVRVLGCPGCGAPQDALFGGTCRHCGRTVNDGSFDWVVQAIHIPSREERPPMLASDVAEKGTDLPSIIHPGCQRRLDALRTKDPAFDFVRFQDRVALIFARFQIAWSNRDLAQMRPFLSDALFSTQAYYVDAYRAQGLRNVTEGARITNVVLAKVTSDRYFDAITLRIWVTGLDYTVNEDGSKVVAGSRSRQRAYSEYWTLIRGTNRKGPTTTELACANCGAPLDVNMAGHCTYCKVKVTTGDFDWVLSRIEQDESYSG